MVRDAQLEQVVHGESVLGSARHRVLGAVAPIVQATCEEGSGA